MEKKMSPEEVSTFSHPHHFKLCGLCGAGCPVPVFLVSCGHCFCLGCLESFWQQLPNCEKPCPTCTLPRESQESLRQHPLQCNLCPVHHPCTARWSCLTCGESYCPEHFQPHMLEEESGGVSLAGHHVCDAAGEEARRMRSVTRRCPQHRDRLVEMYCGICRVCICTLCPLLGSHKGHPVTLIQQEATHKKGIVNNSSSVKGADKLKLSTIIRAVESHLEQLTEEEQEVRNSDKENKEKKHFEGKSKEKNLTNRCLEQLDQKTINVLGNIQNIEQAATELKAHTLASKDSIISKFTELRLLLEEEETFAKKYIDDKVKMVLWAYDGQIETCQDQIKVIDKISTKVRSIHQQSDDIKLIEDYTASEREIRTSMAPAEQWHPVPVTFEHLENYYGSFTETFKSIFKEPLTTRLQKDTFSGLRERATQKPGTLIKTGSFVDRSLFLKHARCPTLDPNTMHPKLRLSEDLLTVNCAWLGKFNSSHPQRFDKLMQIVSRDSYFSGTHYWEVDVLQAGQGWWIGVTYPSIQRKGDSEFSRLGWTSGSWCIKRFDHEYWAFHKGERNAIHLNHHPEKIGVFLDYESGVLSFFDVTAGMRHLHTFRCRFTEPLYPALRLWDGSVTICRLT